MTAPLTADEAVEICEALWPDYAPWFSDSTELEVYGSSRATPAASAPPFDGVDWTADDWSDIMAAVSRLAKMGLVWQFTAHLANAPGADGGCYVAAPIETWGRAILEAVRAAQAQEKK